MLSAQLVRRALGTQDLQKINNFIISLVRHDEISSLTENCQVAMEKSLLAEKVLFAKFNKIAKTELNKIPEIPIFACKITNIESLIKFQSQRYPLKCARNTGISVLLALSQTKLLGTEKSYKSASMTERKRAKKKLMVCRIR